MNMRNRVVHPFPPVYDTDSRILILGSFPSVVSRKQNFYYAHPQNRFWSVLSRVYGIEIKDRVAFLHEHHIALWDVIASCEICGSSDQSISNVTCNDISRIIEESAIACIFTTGGKATELYKRYVSNSLLHISLPSTSSANARMHLDELVNRYSILKEYTDEKD